MVLLDLSMDNPGGTPSIAEDSALSLVVPGKPPNLGAWEALTLGVAASSLGREQTTGRLRRLLHASPRR